jgi:hypothetical protein
MNKVAEIQKTLQDMQHLIESMEHELEKYRYTAYRYYLKHGPEIETGEVKELEDSVDIDLFPRLGASMIDCKGLGTKSNYEKIKEQLKKLRQ